MVDFAGRTVLPQLGRFSVHRPISTDRYTNSTTATRTSRQGKRELRSTRCWLIQLQSLLQQKAIAQARAFSAHYQLGVFPQRVTRRDDALMNTSRVDRNEYFMGIAIAVRERADCRGQKVGAVLVKDDRVIATGYNGTPEGFTNCSDGGCVRCLNREKLYPSGTAYDLCICVHAEQNAILSAARFGIQTEGAVLYTTVQPCFGCLKESLQAKIRRVFYLHPWISNRDTDHENQYVRLQQEFLEGVEVLEMEDPRREWASSRSIPVANSPDPHGMELQ